MQDLRLEIIVFACGAVVMILEIVGSRLLAPYVGTSIFVWTSLIGVILASLSSGYWLGGKLADRRPVPKVLSLLIIAAALYIVLAAYFQNPVLNFISELLADVRIAALVAALVLFTPESALLGAVTPFAVRLKLKDLKASGRTVGNLYALSTFGSIVGTFLAGFFLLATIGSTMLLYLLSGVLIATAFLAFPGMFVLQIFVLVFLGSAASITTTGVEAAQKNGFFDFDTAYARIWIFPSLGAGGATVRNMQISGEASSAMYLDNNDLVYPYTRYYRLAGVFNPDLKTALMIGGAGFSYPKAFLNQFPKSTIDVVEIDPGVVKLAKKYFNLLPNPQLQVVSADGRVFLNQSANHYDVIFGDAFRSYTVPFQLTTTEAARRMSHMLAADGLVMINMIGSVNGDQGRLVRAEYLTFSKVFPQVYLFPVTDPFDGVMVQNIMLLALKTEVPPSWKTDDPVLADYLSHRWTKLIQSDMPILTDDFAPVEYYSFINS